MNLKDNVPPAVLTAAVGLLAPFAPDLSPRSLVAAIKAYKADPTADPDRIERPMTRQEVAALLGCTLQTISRMMNDGRLKRIRLSATSVRIDPDSLRALLAGDANDA